MENIIDYKIYEEEIDEEFEQELEEYKRFEVKDLASADWCLMKIKQNNQVAEEKIAYAKDLIAKANDYIKKADLEKQNANAYLETKLMNYLEERRVDDPKFRIKTLTGTVGTRTTTSWNYDNDKVLAFLKANEMTNLIRVKEELDKKAIKDAFTISESGRYAIDEYGQVVDGITLEEKTSLSIRMAKEK